MKIRPCIDIHDGKVKQIVGGTLKDRTIRAGEKFGGSSAEQAQAIEAGGPGSQKGGFGERGTGKAAEIPENESRSAAEENFVSRHGADYFADIYRRKNLPGGHIILLNSRLSDPGMYEADCRQAFTALSAYPGGMQIGGGITPENAEIFLNAGASHVIVTSFVFRDGKLDEDRLFEMEQAVGKKRLVLDLSCRRWENEKSSGSYVPESRTNRTMHQAESARSEAHLTDEERISYRVVTDRWQKWTELEVNSGTLDLLSEHCDEFLIHAADVEGRQKGIERELVRILGKWLEKREQEGKERFPITYAGGVHSLDDLAVMKAESEGLLDVTVGSALDLFGGNISLDELVQAAGE